MLLREKYAQNIDTFVQVCHQLARNLYVTSHGGNLAWKLADDLLLITPTKINKGAIQPEDLVFIDLKGRVLEGNRRPTGETPMYLKFFNERPDIVSVIHCHPASVCALAICSGKNWLMRPLFPETIIEIGPVPAVPYAEPLTEELANNFVPFLPRHNSFIMENHGLVTMTRGDIEWTMLNVEELESTAHSVILAIQAGGIKELDREAVRRLNNVMHTRSLPLPGAPGMVKSLEELYFDESED
jgi:L-fuculose-phosphate aldolase